MRPEVHCVADILRIGQQPLYRRSAPVIGAGEIGFVLPRAESLLCKIDGGTFDLIIAQDSCDLEWAMTVDAELICPLNDSGSLLINEPVMFVRWILNIPIRRAGRRWLPGPGSGLMRCELLSAAIPEIPFVHDVEERCELAGACLHPRCPHRSRWR